MEEASEPRPGRPSQIPSWVMLGFVLGALFVLALPRPHPPPAPPPPVASVEPAKPLPAPRLTTIEAVFAEWGQYAVWHDDLTEVALWDRDTGSFTDCYEVMRSGGDTYFRSIPRLTEPLLTHGVRPESPLEFTETPAQRQEWLDSKTEETLRALRQSIH